MASILPKQYNWIFNDLSIYLIGGGRGGFGGNGGFGNNGADLGNNGFGGNDIGFGNNGGLENFGF